MGLYGLASGLDRPTSGLDGPAAGREEVGARVDERVRYLPKLQRAKVVSRSRFRDEIRSKNSLKKLPTP